MKWQKTTLYIKFRMFISGLISKLKYITNKMNTCEVKQDVSETTGYKLL